MTTIGKGITIKGSIHADEAITIVGMVTGDVLVAEHDVIVETGAHVDGAVTAKRIIVRGRSSGRLVARELVRLQPSAFVRADIASPTLGLEEGATFSGSVAPARTDAAIRVAAYRGRAEAAAVPSAS